MTANHSIDDSDKSMAKNYPLHQTCYLCGSDNIQKNFSVDDYTIAKCHACSLVFVQEHLTPEELDEFYRLSGVHQVYTEPDNQKNLDFYYERLRDMIQLRIPNGRILDVGCSEGQFLDVMDGWQCYGIELERSSADKARKKHGDNIKSGTLEQKDFAANSFDVITLQDVLDHMPDPVTSLQHCYELLKPGGLIVIKVHNISCLYARFTGKKFYAILPPTHLSYFNLKTLKIALGKSGFTFLSHHFIAHLMFLKTILFRLSGEKQQGLFFYLFRLIEHSWLGRIRVRKNLHDIITVLAVKENNSANTL